MIIEFWFQAIHPWNIEWNVNEICRWNYMFFRRSQELVHNICYEF